MKASKAISVFISVVIGIYCLITVILFAAVFMGSMKTNEELLTNIWGLPKSIYLENFKKVFVDDGFFRYMLNSFLVLAGGLFGAVALSTTVSYGLARFDFKGKKLLTFYFMIGLMFPVQLGIVNLSRVVNGMKLGNSLLGIILIDSAAISMSVLILRGFYHSIPDSLSEAAKIDGAGEFTIFARVILPLLKPAMGAVIPMLAIQYWNDFFIPMVFLTRDEKKTMPIAVMKYSLGEHTDYSKMSILFTVIAVSILPIMILYLVFSKKIIAGITAGAEKG
ncbi:carbohydrate ABC transporter permease [bacterium 1xD8-48]|jgi:raffinose/stachyose/melibiose transport system permease protein|nr:carbohydrate ABC transporter permease [Lachnospiraceae bacterium]NBJ98232.1 carbohydrate ABC transporter permease [bacterium 1xD8-48]